MLYNIKCLVNTIYNNYLGFGMIIFVLIILFSVPSVPHQEPLKEVHYWLSVGPISEPRQLM